MYNFDNFDNLNNLVKLLHSNSIFFNKCLFVIDNKIPQKKISKIIKKFKKNKIIYMFDAKEKNKNQKNLNKILNVLLKNNFQRMIV